MTEVPEGSQEVNAAFDISEELDVDSTEASDVEEGETPEPVKEDEEDAGELKLPKLVRGEITLDSDLYMIPDTEEDHAYMEIEDPTRESVMTTVKEEGEEHAEDPTTVEMEAVLWYRTAIKTTTETTFIKY